MNEMMAHRKSSHTKAIRTCDRFENNACRFTSNSCWFLHEIVIQRKHDDGTKQNKENVDKESNPSVFRKTQLNPDPPLENNMKKQKME